MAFQPGPPPLKATGPTWATLDRGGRPRFLHGKKVAGVLLVLLLIVGTWAATVWAVSGQYLRVADQIVAHSGGAVSSVTIVNLRVAGTVDVVLAPGVGNARAQTVVCDVVVHDLYGAGIGNLDVSVWTSDRVYAGSSDPCKGPW